MLYVWHKMYRGERKIKKRKKKKEKIKKKEDTRVNGSERTASTKRWFARSGAKRLPEREKGGKSAWSRAFIAYGSAKHLWNNGGWPSTSLVKKNESI